MDLYTCCHSRNHPAFCLSFAKTCPFFCRAKRAFPSGETLILPASRDSRYNTLHFASKAVCQRGVPFRNPCFAGSWYSPHKSVVIPFPSKTQAGGIGQPVPGADLCRLLAYMGAYCIAHINRSNLSLPYGATSTAGGRSACSGTAAAASTAAGRAAPASGERQGRRLA